MEKKVAFILCVNDDNEYAECRHYIDRLIVPKGYVTDIIAVYEAPSMAAGYNAAMQQSMDAEYRIYLHQDVFIINRNFIVDMLAVFAHDEWIGLMGCIGVSRLKEHEMAVTAWDAGAILHNCTPGRLMFAGTQKLCTDVEAVDGLLIATRGNIPWREDLFDGWDFYDLSACMEYHRAGYRCVVPRQNEPWCYHDNSYSRIGRYFEYSAAFAREYKDIKPFEPVLPSREALEMAAVKERARAELFALVDMGRRREVTAMFQKEENRGWLHLKEYELLADIEMREEEACTQMRMWETDLSAEELLGKIRHLKYLLIRLAHVPEDDGKTEEEFRGNYTSHAIRMVWNAYIRETKEDDSF